MGHDLDEDLEHCATPVGFNVTVCAVQGGRRYMEDRVHVEAVRDLYGNLSHLFAAVYDGHGGIHASEYVRQHLHNNIKSNKAFYSDDDEEVLSAIRQGFTKTHHNMQKMVEQWPMTSSGFPCTAGTTASVAIIRGGKVYTGHVGDSAIVLASGFGPASASFTARKLTEDHKPDGEAERRRIEGVGGAVALKAGVTRVIWKRPIRGHSGPIRRSTSTENIPFLAVARALGDFWSLNPTNNEYVVSPEPDVAVVELKSSDNFLVLASDGLTNVMKPRQMAEKLRHLKFAGLSSPRCEFVTKNDSLPPHYAQFMIKEALDSWRYVRADNISVVCLQLLFGKSTKRRDSISTSDSASSLFVSSPSFSSLSDLDVDVDVQPKRRNSSDGSLADEDPSMNIDEALTEFPHSLIYVTEKTTQRCLTNAIRLVYAPGGHPSYNNEGFKGPGFVVPHAPGQLRDDELSDDEITTDDYFANRRVSMIDVKSSVADLSGVSPSMALTPGNVATYGKIAKLEYNTSSATISTQSQTVTLEQKVLIVENGSTSAKSVSVNITHVEDLSPLSSTQSQPSATHQGQPLSEEASLEEDKDVTLTESDETEFEDAIDLSPKNSVTNLKIEPAEHATGIVIPSVPQLSPVPLASFLDHTSTKPTLTLTPAAPTISSPSSLLSPFAVLASIRSSASAKRVNELSMRRRSTVSVKTSPPDSSQPPRPPLVNYEVERELVGIEQLVTTSLEPSRKILTATATMNSNENGKVAERDASCSSPTTRSKQFAALRSNSGRGDDFDVDQRALKVENPVENESAQNSDHEDGRTTQQLSFLKQQQRRPIYSRSPLASPTAAKNEADVYDFTATVLRTPTVSRKLSSTPNSSRKRPNRGVGGSDSSSHVDSSKRIRLSNESKVSSHGISDGLRVHQKSPTATASPTAPSTRRVTKNHQFVDFDHHQSTSTKKTSSSLLRSNGVTKGRGSPPQPDPRFKAKDFVQSVSSSKLLKTKPSSQYAPSSSSSSLPVSGAQQPKRGIWSYVSSVFSKYIS